MQVQEGEVPSLGVAVHNDTLHSVDRTVLFGGRVDIASVEIYTVDIYTKVPPGHTIGVEDREDVEDKVIPEYTGKFAIFSEFVNDSGHHM